MVNTIFTETSGGSQGGKEACGVLEAVTTVRVRGLQQHDPWSWRLYPTVSWKDPAELLAEWHGSFGRARVPTLAEHTLKLRRSGRKTSKRIIKTLRNSCRIKGYQTQEQSRKYTNKIEGNPRLKKWPGGSPVTGRQAVKENLWAETFEIMIILKP